MPQEIAPQLDIVAWHKMLRELYTADPIDGSIAALAVMTDAMTNAMELRGSATWDAIVTRGLHTWDRDYEAERLRIEQLRRFVELARPITDPAVRRLFVESNVAGPLFRGIYPARWFDGLSKIAQANVRGSTDGTFRMLGGDASGVATLWNQMSALSLLTTNRTLEWLAASFLAAAEQLETSAPGEPSTAADAVKSTLERAAESAGNLLAAAGSKVAWVVGGLVLAGGFLLWAWRTR